MGFTIDGRGSRQKPVNAELNLVPYIDLLTCMVAFLLITAVWTQLASLSVSQKGPASDGEIDHRSPNQDVAVVVHDDGFNLIVGHDQKPLPRRGGGDLDYPALTAELRAVKMAHPDKDDVKVMSYDGVPYDTLVRTMDATINAGFPDLSLLDAAPGS
jgi:biopolymer transport protein TolR